MTKEKRLGRGLEALLGRLSVPPTGGGEPATPTARPATPEPHVALSLYAPPSGSEPSLAALEASAASRTTVPQPVAEVSVEAPPARLSVDLIDANPYQPRQQFDESDLHSLAESLAAHGLLQPLVVRRRGDRYQLVVGERRLRAARLAGWCDVPVQVVEADDRQMAELAIVENLQRRDLNALEKASSFQRYLEQYRCTQEELASRLKIDRSTIANLIRLLELPDSVQDAIRRGQITQGHARALLPLGDEAEQVEFCRRVQREGLSVRQTEALVQETIDQADAEPLSIVSPPESPKSKRGQPEHLATLEQQFRSALGMKVALKQSARGRGRLVIQFRNHDEFERLRQHICGIPIPTAKAV